MTNPLERLRHHVTGAVKRGDAQPIAGIPTTPVRVAMHVQVHGAEGYVYWNPIPETVVERDTAEEAVIACQQAFDAYLPTREAQWTARGRTGTYLATHRHMISETRAKLPT